MAGHDRKAQTRAAWLEVLKKHAHDFDAPANAQYWSPKLDTASRDELTDIQNDKLAAVTPFLYENSPFYRARFDQLDLTPTDIASVEDLPKWPVLDKSEMMKDATANRLDRAWVEEALNFPGPSQLIQDLAPGVNPVNTYRGCKAFARAFAKESRVERPLESGAALGAEPSQRR